MRKWHPILSGPLLDAASEAIQDIARAITKLPTTSRPSKIWKSDPLIVNASLSGGSAGLALFYQYLDEATRGDGHQQTVAKFLGQASDALSDVPMPAGLYTGFTGVAYAMAHIEKRGSRYTDEAYSEIDEALESYLDRSPWQDDYDLINGLVGIGVYALERLPHPLAKENLERIVVRLGELAEHSDEGITWLTPPWLIPPDKKDVFPHGWYNFGLSHGVPGVIAILGEVTKAGIAQPKSRELLDGAVRWMLSHRLPKETGSWFGTYAEPGHAPYLSRLAWCYGDPGVAVALLSAARDVEEAGWERIAISIALDSTKRPLH